MRVLLYVVLWAGIAVVLTGLLALLSPRPVAHAFAFAGPMTLLYSFVCLSAWWVCKSHPLGTTTPGRLVPTLLGAAVQAAAVWVGIGALWAVVLTRTVGITPDRAVIFRDLAVLFPMGSVLYGQSLVVHYIVLAFQSAREVERRVFESQVAAREAELKALRAQLNPHFLFNSLNSISALTAPDPEAARRMCQLLGDFLRTSLSLGGRERVAFGDELALAERYLSVEQVRFGERLAVAKAIEPGALTCLVPPLLIQPLVENAVKHGVADRIEGGTIEIRARRLGDLLEVTVENPRDPEAPSRRGQGLGLENVRQRLAALDPRRSRVDVTREAERFKVVITLPVEEEEVRT